MKRLILGDLPLDFNRNNDIILGPWSLLKCQDKFISEEVDVEPDPYMSHIELKKDADFSIELTGYYLKKIFPYLNQINNTKHSIKYWHIVLIPYLSTLTQIVIERYRRIEKLIEKYPNGLEVELIGINHSWGFKDTLDFLNNGVLNIRFNHWLISEIILALNISGIKIINLQYNDITKENSKKGVSRIKKIYHKINSIITNNVYFSSVYGVSKVESLFWELYIRTKAHKKRVDNIAFSCFNNILEEPVFVFSLERIIKLSLPSCFKKIYNLKRPKKNRLIICGPINYYNEKAKQKLALHKEIGSRLFFTQHGSRYGTFLSLPYISQIEFCHDGFFTWGWDMQSNYIGNFISLPSPYLIKKTRMKNNKGKVIFVGQHSSLISCRLASAPQPLQHLTTLNQIEDFLKLVDHKLLSKIYFKPYPVDNATVDYFKYFKEKYPSINFFKGKLNKELYKANLIIIDHPGTVFHQALAANIPIIAFWNQNIWGIAPQAIEFFDRLIKAKVLFLNGKDAADHANKVIYDIDNWWSSKTVQTAVNTWCIKYANTSSNWRKKWHNVISNL